MIAWLYSLPLGSMILVVFIAMCLLTRLIYATVKTLAVGERLVGFSTISGGMLPPLGVVYGLFVTIITSQVWGDVNKANLAVTREASALSTVVFLAASFPGEAELRLRVLVRRHIQEAVEQEWPMMAKHTATLKITSQPLSEALQLVLKLVPHSEGQTIAQRLITDAIGEALDARRQRIIVSQSNVSWITWICLMVQAIGTLIAIAMIHSNNRIASLNAMGIFATGVAASVLLIISHNKPFGGLISVSPELLAQVEPEEMLSQKDTSHAIAINLTTLLHSAREVISENQDLINQQSTDKRFTAEKVIAETKIRYARNTGYPLPDLDKNSAEGMMLQFELDAIAEVMNRAQPLINNPNLANKSFLPAIFTYQVAHVFNQKANGLAYLKLTAPEELIRHPSNMPDAWENQVIKTKFQSPEWVKGGFFAEVAALAEKNAYRLMIPEYYQASCLEGCHATPTNYNLTKPFERKKVGDLGGVISVAIYLK